ncbi:polypeptide N-acetylgalactosaminyltransferase 11-like [Amphiura filiformis]|uniref:polypeptide N-acetylgalactosaminyltransferase 11-like n=1 Tax=Amphiura filiformis TaxID=82378 RepID=UPI003B21E13C
MANFRLRCFCYGIVVSSFIWVVIVYMFLTEVGSQKKLPGLADNYLPNKDTKDNRVHFVPKLRRKDWEENGEEDEHWRHNLVIPDDKERKKLSQEHFFGKINEKKHKKQSKLATAAVVEQILKDDDDFAQLGIVRNEKDRMTRDNGYRQHAFNELVSNRIGLHRNATDTRHTLCKYHVYDPPSQLPSTSVVICFYNEAWSTLLRTVYSVIDRTPKQVLHEIILVDDCSALDHLKKKLDSYVAKNLGSLVKVVHNSKREGLIRARVIGAKAATGEVLMFLDSHCEVGETWLEPLLDRISNNKKTVVCPIIDIINADTFVYTSSPIVKGGFNWGLHFKWENVHSSQLSKKEDYVRPIRSPTMAGGLFAMDREYFHKLGEYDEGMDVWGGENLEISFRIWQCGGSLEIVPCSRVGHVFRKRRPYGSGGVDTTTRNALRLANVWMDDYKKFFLDTRPEARQMDYGEVSNRKALRERLKCRSFRWYLQNVYPEMRLPNETISGPLAGGGFRSHRKKPIAIRKGHFVHEETSLCLAAEDKSASKGTKLVLVDCIMTGKEMLWYESDVHELKLADLLCLDMPDSNSASLPRLMKCHGGGGSQDWRTSKGRLYHPTSGQCLSAKQEGFTKYAVLSICQDGLAGQKWDLR